jgi:hypothetical protein
MMVGALRRIVIRCYGNLRRTTHRSGPSPGVSNQRLAPIERPFAVTYPATATCKLPSSSRSQCAVVQTPSLNSIGNTAPIPVTTARHPG